MTHSYCTLPQLKTQEMGIAAADVDDDARLLRIAEQVTQAIDDYCRRTFQPYLATNYYTYRAWAHAGDELCGALILPDDLLSVTTLKTLTEYSGVGARTYGDTWATTDYDKYPQNAPSRREPYWAIVQNPYGLLSWPADRQGVEVVGIWGYWQELARSTATLAEALDTSETGVDVSDGAQFEVGHTLLVDAEQLYVKAIATNTLTVERAQNGTAAAAHSSGAAIDVYRYPRPITDAAILQAQQWNRSFQSGGGDFAGGGQFVSRVAAGLHPNIASALASYRRLLAVS